MATVGPGSVQEVDTDIKPSLDGASEFEYVTILNPLTDDFAVKVAQDVPVNLPFNIGRDGSGQTAQTTLSEGDAARTYGLSLKNPDFQGRKHIENNTIIKAGQTINLKGNEAQVAVKQLVDEYLQRAGKSRLMSDPTLRKEAEELIIQKRGSVQELMDTNLQTPQQQLNTAISQSNEVNDEVNTQAVGRPDTSQATGTAPADNSSGVEAKPVGRPKATDS